MTDGQAPPGWPRGVLAPGVPDWEASAAGWLLDGGWTTREQLAINGGSYDEALQHLRLVRQTDAAFRAEEVALLLAQALAAAGQQEEAGAEFAAAATRFGSFESRAEYAIWAAQRGDRATAQGLQTGLQADMDRWSRHTRALNQPLLRRLQAALAQAGLA